MSEAFRDFQFYISQMREVQDKLALDPENAELLKTQTELDRLLKTTRPTFTETDVQALVEQTERFDHAALVAASGPSQATSGEPDSGTCCDTKGYI